MEEKSIKVFFNPFLPAMYNDLLQNKNERYLNIDRMDSIFPKVLSLLDTDINREEKNELMEGLTEKNNLLNANICIFIKEFDRARDFLERAKTELGVKTLVTGRLAKARYFDNIENAFLVLSVNDDEKGELFSTERLNFIDFYVSPLDTKTQALIFTELELIMRTTYDSKYLSEIVECYIDRLKYKNNDNNFLCRRMLFYYESHINNKVYYELDNAICSNEPVDIGLLQILPLVTDKRMKLRLAAIYMRSHLYNQALPICREMKLFDDVVRCYIGLDMEEKAKKILIEEVNAIEVETFESKVKLQEIYLLLAALCRDVKYFDLAFDTYKTSEAKRLKALFLLDKDRKQSICEFRHALKINRTEKILFSYACALYQNGDYTEAAKVYNELLFFDPNNYKLHTNLASCYSEIGDMINACKSMRKALIYNYSEGLLRIFLLVCMKNERLEEIEIAKKHFAHNETIRSIIEQQLNNPA